LASDPKRFLAPDGFVRLGRVDDMFDNWKTWERGAPELCVEIVSEFDPSLASWERKLVRYHELGALEVVRFDPELAEGKRIRVWDRLENDLVERLVESDTTPCTVLGLHWVVVPTDLWPLALRLARDPAGRDLVPTKKETAERARENAERSRADAESARDAAERRVRELEEELRRARG
jgi:hypothetical protein